MTDVSFVAPGAPADGLRPRGGRVDVSDRPAASGKLPVTCVILARNERALIARCIESVATFCADVMVFDTGSSDGTQEIAEAHGARVVEAAWPGSHGLAKNRAMLHARHDWCLHLDADEVVDRALALAIIAAVRAGPPPSTGFCMTRQNEFAGVAIPSRRRPGRRLDLVRLFNRNRGRFTAEVHETVVGIKRRALLGGRLYHWRSFSMDARFRQWNDYATMEAELLHARGVRHSVGRLLFRPLARFAWHYFPGGSWRVGRVGLLHAMTRANAEFMREAKLWELQRAEPVSAPRLELYRETEVE